MRTLCGTCALSHAWRLARSWKSNVEACAAWSFQPADEEACAQRCCLPCRPPNPPTPLCVVGTSCAWTAGCARHRRPALCDSAQGAWEHHQSPLHCWCMLFVGTMFISMSHDCMCIVCTLDDTTGTGGTWIGFLHSTTCLREPAAAVPACHDQDHHQICTRPCKCFSSS